MAGKSKLPAPIQDLADRFGVQEIDEPITREQVRSYGALQDIRERVRHHRTFVAAWRQQQDQDRKMRKLYANWLMIAMSVQVVAINVIFVLMGSGTLKFEQWTANTFIITVFAEISALVVLVVKYLFPATADRTLDLIDRFGNKGRGD
jgi:hypothetical protein